MERWSGREYEFVRRIGPAGAGAVGVLALTSSRTCCSSDSSASPSGARCWRSPPGCATWRGRPPRSALGESSWRRPDTPLRGIEPLGRGFFSSSGLTDERYLLYRAAVPDAPSADPEAGIDLVRMPFAEALREVEDGGIEDAKTALALLLAARAGA